MAVIDTSMDMPMYCWSSDGKRFIYCARYETCPYKDKWNVESRPSDCPLKSTDEMIAEIEDKICSFNYFASEVTTRDAILKIIRKYCDKEQKND